MPTAISSTSPTISFDVLLFEQLIAAACNTSGITTGAARDVFVAGATQAQMNVFTKIVMQCFVFGPPKT